MTPRLLEKNIRKAAEQYPVITVTGPRQSGKTTLIRALFPDNEYVSLEEPELRQLASEDPRGFLTQFRGKNVILDEVQRTQDLYFWRDSAGHELDIIIDLGNRLIPVEVKSGHTIAQDFFKGLNFWKTLSNNPSAPAALIYAGNRSLHQKNTAVYSWWNF